MTRKEGDVILKYLFYTTDALFGIGMIIAFFLAFIKMHAKRRDLMIFISSIVIGILSGFTVFLIKINNPKKTNLAIIKYHRYIIILIALVSIICLVSFILVRLRGKCGILNTIILSILVLLSLASIMPTVFNYTTEFVYFGEDNISSMMLLRIIGYTLGIILIYITALSLYKLFTFLDDKRQYRFIIYFMLVQAIDYIVKTVISLQRLKLIPLNDIVFKIMIFGDNYGNIFIYLKMLIILRLLIYIYRKNRHVSGDFENNAKFRKEKAKLRNRRRWSKAILLETLLVLIVITAVHSYITREVPLTPPQPYEEQGEYIVIDTEDINDGHLHRFSYKTPNGFDVRFIAVKKPQGTTYGLGLDACEICGIAGYFERGDDVICKRCDVVMNKNTIGFEGGCNPIPFPYEIEDNKIYINKKDLVKEEMRFR